MADLITLSNRINTAEDVHDSVKMPFSDRQKARQRVCAESGQFYGIKLPRGTVLRGGDILQSQCGRTVQIQAAPETISLVTSDDPSELARVAYHLGNRHVWVEVGRHQLSYLHDHVLDDMVRQLGSKVTVLEAPFEPEAGAYAEHHHPGHGHSHTSDENLQSADDSVIEAAQRK
jgi:urease accessory protein